MSKKGCFIISSIFLLGGALCFCTFGFIMFAGASAGLSDEGYQEKVISTGNVNEKIAIISLDGVIISAPDSPFSDEGSNMVDDVVSKLQKVQSDDSFKAVIFTVNTPGGSVYDSDKIAKEVIKTKEGGVKVIALMEESATSGGYYVSAPADKIVASEVTVTGSIGVVTQIVDMEGLYEKLGIKIITVTNTEGDVKTFENVDDPNSEDRKNLQQLLDDDFEAFIKMIDDNRDMTREEILAIADGSIFSGKRAKELGLVDELGGIDEAIELAKSEAGLEDPQIIEMKNTEELWSDIFGPGIFNDLGIFSKLDEKVNIRPGVYSFYIALD